MYLDTIMYLSMNMYLGIIIYLSTNMYLCTNMYLDTIMYLSMNIYLGTNMYLDTIMYLGNNMYLGTNMYSDTNKTELNEMKKEIKGEQMLVVHRIVHFLIYHIKKTLYFIN